MTRLSGMTTAQIDRGVERAAERALCREEARIDRLEAEHDTWLESWGGDDSLPAYFDSIIDKEQQHGD